MLLLVKDIQSVAGVPAGGGSQTLSITSETPQRLPEGLRPTDYMTSTHPPVLYVVVDRQRHAANTNHPVVLEYRNI